MGNIKKQAELLLFLGSLQNYVAFSFSGSSHCCVINNHPVMEGSPFLHRGSWQIHSASPVPWWLSSEVTACHPLSWTLWPSVVHAVMAHGRVMLKGCFSGRKWGCSPPGWKDGRRSEVLEQEEYFKGKERRRYVGLSLFGFPWAVGCGKHRGWQTWTEVRKWPGELGGNGPRRSVCPPLHQAVVDAVCFSHWSQPRSHPALPLCRASPVVPMQLGLLSLACSTNHRAGAPSLLPGSSRRLHSLGLGCKPGQCCLPGCRSWSSDCLRLLKSQSSDGVLCKKPRALVHLISKSEFTNTTAVEGGLK